MFSQILFTCKYHCQKHWVLKNVIIFLNYSNIKKVTKFFHLHISVTDSKVWPDLSPLSNLIDSRGANWQSPD